jgi:hypothetical protein
MAAIPAPAPPRQAQFFMRCVRPRRPVHRTDICPGRLSRYTYFVRQSVSFRQDAVGRLPAHVGRQSLVVCGIHRVLLIQ